MQVAAGQDGIQRLLAAEKEAQQIVAQARKGRDANPKQLEFHADVDAVPTSI